MPSSPDLKDGAWRGSGSFPGFIRLASSRAASTIWLPAVGITGESSVAQLVDHLSQAFTLALRIASPFVIYAVIVNLAVGLANKLTPTIPVYFISLPFVLFGGLLLLYLTSREMVLQFNIAFAAWLAG